MVKKFCLIWYFTYSLWCFSTLSSVLYAESGELDSSEKAWFINVVNKERTKIAASVMLGSVEWGLQNTEAYSEAHSLLIKSGKAAARLRVSKIPGSDDCLASLIKEDLLRLLEPYTPSRLEWGTIFKLSQIRDVGNQADLDSFATQEILSNLKGGQDNSFYGFWTSPRSARELNQDFPSSIINGFSSRHQDNTVFFKVVSLRAFYGFRFRNTADIAPPHELYRIMATRENDTKPSEFDLSPRALNENQVEVVMFFQTLGEPRPFEDQELLRLAFSREKLEREMKNLKRGLNNASSESDKQKYESQISELAAKLGHSRSLDALIAEIKDRGITATEFVYAPVELGTVVKLYDITPVFVPNQATR